MDAELLSNEKFKYYQKRVAKEHDKLHKLANTCFNVSLPFLVNFAEKTKNDAFFFIQGSRAWEKWFETTFNTQHLRPRDFQGTCYDIAIITCFRSANDVSSFLRRVHSYVTNEMMRFLDDLEVSIGEMFHHDDKTFFLTPLNGYKGYEININHNHVGSNGETDTLLRLTIYNAGFESTMTTMSFDKLHDNWSNFLTFYDENMTTNLPFLNIEGLSMFLSTRMQRWNRLDKLRVKAVLRKFNINPIEHAFECYDKLFRNTRLYDVKLANLLFVGHLRFLDNEIDAALDEIEHDTINRLRPVMNACLECLNGIFERKGISSEAYGFIAGGDAFERFIPTGSTKDIDIKLIYSDGSFDEIRNMVLPILGKVVVELNRTMSANSSASVKSYANGKVYYDTQRTKYRLRNFDNETFMVDLVSIDVKIPIAVQYYSMEVLVELVMSPLDIVFIPNDGYFVKDRDTVYYDLRPNLLIASPEYLLRDLKMMYTNYDNMARRIEAGKREKDAIRYDRMRRIASKFQVNDRVKVNSLFEYLNEVDKKFVCKPSTAGKKYVKTFDTIRTKRRKQGKYKHFMSFHHGTKKNGSKLKIRSF